MSILQSILKSTPQSHPEIKEGEVYLGNSNVLDFHNFRWKSKRLGNVAYSHINGKLNLLQRAPELRPVFVQRSEIEQADSLVSTR